MMAYMVNSIKSLNYLEMIQFVGLKSIEFSANANRFGELKINCTVERIRKKEFRTVSKIYTFSHQRVNRLF